MKGSEIAAHPFFADLSPKHLEALAGFAMRTSFATGESIFRERETANRFYLLLSGTVELSSASAEGERILTQAIGAGEVVGWSWLVPPYEWQFSARAVEDTDAIFFYGTMLRAECERDHELGYQLMCRVAAVMLQRLQATRQQPAMARMVGS